MSAGKRSICFLDTETTGLDANKEKLVEIGVIIHEYDDETASVSKDSIERCTLINPCIPIPKAVQNIHGISDKDVANSPLFKDIVKSIAKVIPEGSIIVAHNAPFDLRFLFAEAYANGMGDWIKSLSGIDTLAASRSLRKGKRHSLDALCTEMGVPLPEKGRHRAIVDCRMLRDAFIAWTGKLGNLILPKEFHPMPTSELIGTSFLNTIEGIKSTVGKQTFKPRAPLAIPTHDQSAHDKMMERVKKDSGDNAIWAHSPSLD